MNLADQTIDTLAVQITSKITGEKKLETFGKALMQLGASIGSVDTNKMSQIGTSLGQINTALASVKTADVSRLVKNINKLGEINASGVSSGAAAITQLGNSLSGLAIPAETLQSITALSNAIRTLGSASVSRAIANLPMLATGMRNFMQTMSSAPRVSENLIRMTEALARLSSQGQRAGTAGNALNRILVNQTRVSANTTKGINSISSAIGRLYASYFMVIRAVKAFMKSIGASSDYIEAYNYFNVALGKVADEWSHQYEDYGYENAETYAESFSGRLNELFGKMSGLQLNEATGLVESTGMQSLGLNLTELTQYASNVAALTNSLDMTGESTVAVSKAMTMLAGDLSSLKNIDLESVMGNLQSGLIGQSRALYKYGIDITNATLQTYAFNLGLKKSVTEMTQGEKAQLRMLAILDQSRVAWGDLANRREYEELPSVA